MDTDVSTGDVELATRLVMRAATTAAEIRSGGNLRTRSKTSVSDVVTAADLAAEQFVVEAIRTERPDDGLLGEEGATWEGTSGRRWIIDPVDGTFNFASGSDYWCSAIALARGDEVLLGAVAHHATGDLFVGGPSVPTTRNGDPLAPMTDASAADLGGFTYLHPGVAGAGAIYETWLRAAQLPATLRMFGSASMDLAGVATRRAGLWFQNGLPEWDWMPGFALVAGIGGTTRRIDVGDVPWTVAGPSTAVAEIVAALSS